MVNFWFAAVVFVASLFVLLLSGLTWSLECGRTSCYGKDSTFLGDSPFPFLPNQRCSCSMRCALFDDCCEDFRAFSKSYIKMHSLSHLTAEVMGGQRPIDSVICSLPRTLADRNQQVHFADNVPPFYRVGNCPDDAPEIITDQNDPQANNIFVSSWPIVDVTTGIVYDNINIARCNSPLQNQDEPPPRLSPLVRGPLKYWSSFSILCHNESETGLIADFNPFNPEHAQQLITELGCVVELTDPKNPVMLPISFCAPFTSANRVVQSGCIVSGSAITYDDGCLNGNVEIVAIYASPTTTDAKDSVPTLYRNSDCAKCSGFDDEDEHNCSFSVERGWRYQRRPPMRLRAQLRKLTDFNTFRMMMDFSWSPEDIVISSDSNQIKCNSENNEVYVPFLGSCQQLKIKAEPVITAPPASLSSTTESEFSTKAATVVNNQSNCYIELNPSSVQYEITKNGTLKLKSLMFQPNQYQLGADNKTVVVRYCFDALMPSDDDRHLHGEREIPIRDIISRFITFAFMILSIISLAFLLVVYGLFPQLRNVPGKVIICLSATLLIALFWYGVGVLALEKIWYPFCFTISVCIQYCFISSFAFSSCLAYDIWQAFRSGSSASDKSKSSYHRYSLFGWGVPAIVCFISMIAEFLPISDTFRAIPKPRYSMPIAILHPADFHNSDYHQHAVWVCWMMNRKGVLAYFKVPIGLCLLLNAIFLGMTIFHIRRSSEHSVRAGRGHSMRLKRRLFIYLKLSVIMGMTWLFGFIAAATNIEALWIPFGLSNALQGFYICMTFVFTKKVARLLRGWAAGENRGSINPRLYASSNSNTTTSTLNASQSMPLRTAASLTDQEQQGKFI